MPTVTIRDEAASGRVISRFHIPIAPERTTLGRLIRDRVRADVARYQADRGDLFRGLVRPIDAEDVRDGYRLPGAAPLRWEPLAGVALAAFERSGYSVVVDGRLVSDLDAELDLRAGSEVAFRRSR